MAQRAATVIALALISSCGAVEDFGDEDDGAPAIGLGQSVPL